MPKISLNIDDLTAEQSELTTFLSRPDAYNDPNFSSKNRRLGELESLISKATLRDSLEQQLTEAKELAGGGDELAELAKAEIPDLEQQLETLEDELFILLTPKDPNDEKNVIIEIRAGAGGDEAAIFGGDLYRMYLRYCESHGFKTDLMSENRSDNGGYKEVIFEVKGDAPYATFKFESGVHRVQRVPATESQGRIHTSTATVAVLPEAEETDIQIAANELKIDVYRAGGHGGQSVNTTDSAVRITHLPTNTVVAIQNERSQLQNKETAMKILRGKLAQMRMEQHAETLADLRAGESASWGAQIRNYVLHPYTMVKDARTKHETRDAAGVLDGKLDEFIDTYLEAYSGTSD